MENRRAFLISFICVTISFALVLAWKSVRKSEMTAEFGEEVPVVVAAAGIPEFGIIRPEMLEVRKVFKNFRQPQTVTDVADIIGKAAYVPIYRNEQITLTKLIHQDGKPVLDRQVEKKMRAVTVQISPSSGVAKLIRPGNHVDIIAAPNYEAGGTNVVEVKTVVQNALVLATGKNLQNSVPTHVDKTLLTDLETAFEQRKRKDFTGGNTEGLSTGRPDDNYTNLTLQLSPEDAEKVVFLASTFGDQRLTFELRNGADHNTDNVDTTILDEVLGPNSDYGESKRKPPPLPPSRGPRFYDNQGGKAVPVY